MAGLSNIFGNGDDSSSSNDQGASNEAVGNIDSALGLDATNSNSSSQTDDDGSSSSNSSDQTLGLDTSTDGLLGSLTDAFSSSDESSN